MLRNGCICISYTFLTTSQKYPHGSSFWDNQHSDKNPCCMINPVKLIGNKKKIHGVWKPLLVMWEEPACGKNPLYFSLHECCIHAPQCTVNLLGLNAQILYKTNSHKSQGHPGSEFILHYPLFHSISLRSRTAEAVQPRFHSFGDASEYISAP